MVCYFFNILVKRGLGLILSTGLHQLLLLLGFELIDSFFLLFDEVINQVVLLISRFLESAH